MQPFQYWATTNSRHSNTTTTKIEIYSWIKNIQVVVNQELKLGSFGNSPRKINAPPEKDRPL